MDEESMKERDQKFYDDYIARLDIKISEVEHERDLFRNAVLDILDRLDDKPANRLALKSIDAVIDIKDIAEQAVLKSNL